MANHNAGLIAATANAVVVRDPPHGFACHKNLLRPCRHSTMALIARLLEISKDTKKQQ